MDVPGARAGQRRGDPGGGEGDVGARPPAPRPLSAAPHMPPRPPQPVQHSGPGGGRGRTLVFQTPSGWGVTSGSGSYKIPSSRGVSGRRGAGRAGAGPALRSEPPPGLLDTCFRRPSVGSADAIYNFKSSCSCKVFLNSKYRRGLGTRSRAAGPAVGGDEGPGGGGGSGPGRAGTLGLPGLEERSVGGPRRTLARDAGAGSDTGKSRRGPGCPAPGTGPGGGTVDAG